VKNELLHRVKEESKILCSIKRGRANWIGRILRRNCLLKHVIGGKINSKRRGGRIRKQLLDKNKILEFDRRSTKLQSMEFRLAESMERLQDRQSNKWMNLKMLLSFRRHNLICSDSELGNQEKPYDS
jgi:hypothetical protein